MRMYLIHWLGRGDVVTSFEAGFANSLVADPKDFYALSCCTEGLFLTADLFDFGREDEIIVPSISFIAAGSAVVSSGASLVICDVDSRTLNATVESISACVTSKTKAIILNHYGGYPCDMDAICALAESNGIVIIEDAACAEVFTRASGGDIRRYGHLVFRCYENSGHWRWWNDLRGR